MSPEERQVAFLCRLAKMTEAGPGNSFPWAEVGAPLGLDQEVSSRVALALERLGFVMLTSRGVWLTPQGRDKVDTFGFQEIQRTALVVLRAAEPIARKDDLGFVEKAAIQGKLKLTDALATDVLNYLDQRQQIEWIDDTKNTFKITSEGFAQLQPSSRSNSGPTIFGSVFQGPVIGSQVVSAGRDANQTGSFDFGSDKTELIAVVAQIRDAIASMTELATEAREDAQECIQTLDTQLGREKPDGDRVKASLDFLAKILKVATSPLAKTAYTALLHWVAAHNFHF